MCTWGTYGKLRLWIGVGWIRVLGRLESLEWALSVESSEWELHVFMLVIASSILAAEDWATHTFVQGLEPACGRAKYLRVELEIIFSENPDWLAWQLL